MSNTKNSISSKKYKKRLGAWQVAGESAGALLSPSPRRLTRTRIQRHINKLSHTTTVAQNNGTSAGGAPAGSEQLSLGALGSTERVWRCPEAQTLSSETL